MSRLGEHRILHQLGIRLHLSLRLRKERDILGIKECPLNIGLRTVHRGGKVIAPILRPECLIALPVFLPLRIA